MSDRCPVENNSSVCSRVLPACQHRPVRYPLGIPTSAINQTMPAAAIKVSYARMILRQNNKRWAITPNYLLEQQTAVYYSYISSRFLVMFLNIRDADWPTDRQTGKSAFTKIDIQFYRDIRTTIQGTSGLTNRRTKGQIFVCQYRY